MAPTTIPEDVGMSSARLERIAPAMQKWIDNGTISGASMMIARHGQIAYDQQIGHLGKDQESAMESDTIVRIFSMTKPIVCTALMMLFEEGHFQLHTPVSKFIPAMGQGKVLEVDSAGEPKEVDQIRPPTVGELMSHTAGFTYDFLVDSPVGELYRQAKIGNDASRPLGSFIEELARLPLAYQPGSRWHYSVSIDVAAHLIEIIADQPLRDFLQERIFGPLNMVDTDFCVPEEKLPRLAKMYGVADLIAPGMTLVEMFMAWQQGIHNELDMSVNYPVDKPDTFARGGHALFSTASDYMRFALMLQQNGVANGERLIGRKTLELMHDNRIPAHLLPWEIGGLVIPGYGFGLGSRTMMNAGMAGVPGSVGEYGWAGAASTFYWVDPVEEMVGVFMTQYQGIDEPDRDFRVLAYQAITE